MCLVTFVFLFFFFKEGLYSQANVSSSDRDVNALILCSYIIISLRTTQRLSSVFNLSLQNLATCAYQIHQNLDLGSSKVFVCLISLIKLKIWFLAL